MSRGKKHTPTLYDNASVDVDADADLTPMITMKMAMMRMNTAMAVMARFFFVGDRSSFFQGGSTPIPQCKEQARSVGFPPHNTYTNIANGNSRQGMDRNG